MLALVLASLCHLERAQEPRPPDVLLIVIDDLNDWVGHLGGHPNAHTPHIDRLAAQGVTFTNAHVASPVCNPSRTAMFGGVRPRPGRKRGQPWQITLGKKIVLPRHFGANGYELIGTGKFFHGASGDAFDQFLRPGRTKAAVEPPGTAVDLGLEFPADDGFDWRALDVRAEDMPDYTRVTQVAEQLMRADETPLFIAVGFHKPHLPWYVPREFFDLYPLEGLALPETIEGDLDDVPAAARELVTEAGFLHPRIVERDLWAEGVQAYLATISFIDAQVGRLLDALEASPRADRTIVLLVSDHGHHLGEKEHWRKTTLWEESTRVPLIVVTPGAERGGVRCDRPVDTMSIYPTLCELAGLSTPEHVEGPSLAPLLSDPGADWPHAAVTTFERHNTIRTDRWRLIVYGDGTRELYDHASDPGEFHNLAGDDTHADVLAELREQLARTTRRR
jgi:arylsulfatase A-like enzyme